MAFVFGAFVHPSWSSWPVLADRFRLFAGHWGSIWKGHLAAGNQGPKYSRTPAGSRQFWLQSAFFDRWFLFLLGETVRVKRWVVISFHLLISKDATVFVCICLWAKTKKTLLLSFLKSLFQLLKQAHSKSRLSKTVVGPRGKLCACGPAEVISQLKGDFFSRLKQVGSKGEIYREEPAGWLLATSSFMKSCTLFFPECVAKGSRLTWESEGRAVFARRCFRVRNRSQLFESVPYGPAVGPALKSDFSWTCHVSVCVAIPLWFA